MKKITLGMFIGFFIGVLCLWSVPKMLEYKNSKLIQAQIEKYRNLASNETGPFHFGFINEADITEKRDPYWKGMGSVPDPIKEYIPLKEEINQNCDPDGALSVYRYNGGAVYSSPISGIYVICKKQTKVEAE